MSLSPRLARHAWIAVLAAAVLFVCWADARRAARVERVTAMAGAPPAPDPASPTGYAGGVRHLIVPGHNNDSYQWLAQTQQMLAEKTWRVRNVGYDNAPLGRPVLTPSPYRWWLAAVAQFDHVRSGRPVGLAVERAAALWADPVLHLLLIAGVAVFGWWRFGGRAAGLLALTAASMFPLASLFTPGAPDDRGLVTLASLASVLTLLAGLLSPPAAGKASAGRWFAAAGVSGAALLWLNVPVGVPLIAGIGAGALLALWFSRGGAAAVPARAWRTWGYGGAIAVVTFHLIEYAPAHLGWREWRLTEIHPLYAVAWAGLAELLARLQERAAAPVTPRRAWLSPSLAVLAIASVPAAMALADNPGFLLEDNFAERLTSVGAGAEAPNLATWIVKEGASLRLLATLVPLVILGLAGRRLCQRWREPVARTALLVVGTPALIAFALACAQLGWWVQLDAVLLALLAAVLATTGPSSASASPARVWAAAAGLLLPGVLLLAPGRSAGPDAPPSRQDLESLIERDLAHWLARRVGPDGAIVLAPPNLTTSLYFHGGLRGLGSPHRENPDGFRASVRLAGAVSADEAQALARQRQLTHIVIPSWDGFLDEYARLGSGDVENSLMGLLHSWLPPRWLKPVAFHLPPVEGFADERIVIFEVTDLQDNAMSISRLAEYFLDMGQVELASMAGRALGQAFAADLGAKVAKAQTEFARRDRAAFAQSLEAILASLGQEAEEALPWDRRVSLCLVLAEGEHIKEAREQAERCLQEMGEYDLRDLSTRTLFRFLTLCRALGLELRDPALRDLALELLPPDMRPALR